tara:strand:- start:19681 stop:20562 length:882 start_codon:yes stop_codon:yes gene_type:complete
MNTTPKTIQIFLPSGDPRGIRIAEITTRIVQVIEVPRSLLPEFLAMPESGQVAVYFLFGTSEDEDSQRVYIGQTGDLRARLKSHNTNKDFWERALVLVSKTNSMTQTHALFLEWHCLQISRQAGRFTDENGNSGSQPYTPPPMEADCHEIFDTGKTLLATLGYPIFSSIVSTPSKDEGEPIVYFCTASDTQGRGIYTPDGFVILKGSIGRTAMTDALASTASANIRNKILQSADIDIHGDKFTMQVDRLFQSPSAAAKFLTGGSKNGWITWKTVDGRTLDDIERASVERDNDA